MNIEYIWLNRFVKMKNMKKLFKLLSNSSDYNHQKRTLQFTVKLQMNDLSDSEKIINNACEDRQETF